MDILNEISEYFSNSPYLKSKFPTLSPLPYPVYFVTKDPKWINIINDPDFLSKPELFSLESLYAGCVRTNDIWSAQVYLDLKQCGLNVHLVSEPIPNQICFIPYYYLKNRDWLYKSYVIACYHDCPRPFLCNQRFVLNHTRLSSPGDHFIPHRPQPNLRPRNQARGATVENLVFKGEDYNLFDPFRTAEFIASLNEMGIKLITNTELSGNPFENWSNYIETDVLIAVRNTTKFDTSLKPALKLINAWMAGSPALLSPEPAYQRLRKSSLDYIEIYTPEDAITALKYLKNNPDIYLAMVENGFHRAQEFTVERIVESWYRLLSGPVIDGYERWMKQSAIQRKIVRPLQYFWQIMAQKRARKIYTDGIDNGPRILTEPDGDKQLILPKV